MVEVTEGCRMASFRTEAEVFMNGLCDLAITAPHMTFDVRCFGTDGEEKWREVAKNVVTTAGKVNLLERFFRATSYTAAWHLVLAGPGTKSANDTLSSHPAWAEVSAYSGGRPPIVWNAAAANGANGRIVSQMVSVVMTGVATIAGAGVCDVSTGTSGILYNCADFSSTRMLASGDTINVTITIDVT